jgi:hypothetical protein
MVRAGTPQACTHRTVVLDVEVTEVGPTDATTTVLACIS